MIRRFLGDDSGVTAIEYGLIGALVAVAAVSAFSSLGSQLSAVFSGVGGKLIVPT